MKSITELEKRIQCLEKENQYLKHLLADAGISYSIKSIDEYDPNQGVRILPRNITETGVFQIELTKYKKKEHTIPIHVKIELIPT